MIIKGKVDTDNSFRLVYDLDKENDIKLKHFVVRTTTPGNPFHPHKHEQEELWYMIEGNGIYTENGVQYPVESGDLVQIKPWVLHGLSTETKIVWICLG